MLLKEITPFVRQAIVAKMSLEYTSYKLKTRDHRLFYIMGGTGNVVIEGRAYPIRSGMIVLFRSGTEYIWQVTNMRYAAINFDYLSENTHVTRSLHVERAELVDSVLEPDAVFSDAEVLNRPVVLYDAAGFEPSVMSIITEFGVKGEYSQEYVSTLLKLTVISLAKKCAEAKISLNSGSTVVKKVISYIQANYTKPIKNTDVAYALHLNPSYMNRVFKAHTGITVRAFIIDYRINAAIELISGGELSTEQLAEAVGFSDVPHFIKTFKAHTGKTPKAYAKG